MTELVAVAAYGKVAGLTNEECVTLWQRAERVHSTGAALLSRLDGLITEIKVARAMGLRDAHQPVMTHEQWKKRLL